MTAERTDRKLKVANDGELNEDTAASVDRVGTILRWVAGGIVILAALGVLVWVFIGLTTGQDLDAIAAFTAFAGPVTTIVSAYFGIQATSNAAANASRTAEATSAHASAAAETAIERMAELSKAVVVAAEETSRAASTVAEAANRGRYPGSDPDMRL